jgi:hypothetical protein
VALADRGQALTGQSYPAYLPTWGPSSHHHHRGPDQSPEPELGPERERQLGTRRCRRRYRYSFLTELTWSAG